MYICNEFVNCKNTYNEKVIYYFAIILVDDNVYLLLQRHCQEPPRCRRG